MPFLVDMGLLPRPASGLADDGLRADGLPDHGAVFGRPDFAAVARGFGITGRRLDDLADLPALVGEVIGAGGPAVIDVPVSDKVVSPVIQRSHG